MRRAMTVVTDQDDEEERIEDDREESHDGTEDTHH